MDNSIIRRVIILGALAIAGIIVVQSYWVIQALDLKEKEFRDKVNIALRRTAEDLAVANNTTLPTHNLINQLASDYYVVNINDVIDANSLEFFLRKEMDAVSLKENFEYGIYDCASNTMVYGDYIRYDVDDQNFNPEQELPTYDEFIYYFGVRFPGRGSHLLSEMRLPILFSVLLLLAISFFAYSIFVILKQKRLSEMQRDFINNMTHEFKTPISTIKISADVFLKDEYIKQDNRLSRYAQVIRDQNLRLNNQVEKVLQLAQIEKDNFRLQPVPCDLHEIIEEVIQSVEVRISEKNGTIRADLEASDAIVLADKLHLSNILYSIVDNAIKYSKEVPEIFIHTEDKPKGILLTIADKGIGISPDLQPKVFDKFYRVPTGNVHDVKGFGLGLFYVSNVVEAHGWSIELESAEGVGTSVIIYLKRKASKRS